MPVDFPSIDLSEYILLSREERVAHIDLDSDCECGIRTRVQDNKKVFKTLCRMNGIINDVPNRRAARICICHLCGNKLCFNPKHTYLGTSAENQQDIPDAIRRERVVLGNSRMTPEARSQRAKKGKENMTADQKRAAAQKRLENTTPEERSRVARAGGLANGGKNKKRVRVVTPSGNTLIFESLTAAAKDLKLNLGCLSAVCNGYKTETLGHTAQFMEQGR